MKKFISGFLLAAIMFSSLGVYASNSRAIEVFYSINDIVINKISKMPTTQDQKPFVFNGTTYVPLRYISENLGFPVNYDGSTRTIAIGDTYAQNAYFLDKDISHMNHQYRGYFSYTYSHSSDREFVEDNLGNEYGDFLIMYLASFYSQEGYNFLEFPLNGEFKTFKATLGLTDKYKSTTTNMTVRVYADDNLIYSKEMKAGDMLTDINLDVSNALKIKFELSAPKNADGCQIGFFNPVFYK